MKKKVTLFLTGLLVANMMTGCSYFKPTTEKVIEKMSESIAECKSVEADIVMDMVMELKASGLEVPLEIELDFEMASLVESEEESIARMEGDMSLNAMGEKLSSELLTYTVVESDESITYKYDSESDIWTKTSEEVNSKDVAEYDYSMLAGLLTLKEDTEEFEEKTCYVLNGKVDNEDMQDITSSMDMLSDEVSETLEDCEYEFDVTCYIEEKTYKPVGYVFALKDMKFGKDMESLTAFFGEDADFSMDELNIEIVFTDWDALDELELPKEAEDAEEEIIIDFGTLEMESETETTNPVPDAAGESFGSVTYNSDGSVSIEYDVTIPLEETESSSTGNQDETNAPADVQPSEEVVLSEGTWQDLEYTFEGELLALNTSYREFESLGWGFNPEDYGINDDYTLEGGEYTYNSIELNNPNYNEYYYSVRIGLCNNGAEACKIKDCSVQSITVDVKNAMQDGKVFPQMSVNGLKFGDSEEQVLSIMGNNYDNKYESEYGFTTYEWNYEYTVYFIVTVGKELGVTSFKLSVY